MNRPKRKAKRLPNKTRRLLVQIKGWDLERGERRSTGACPLARAIKRSLHFAGYQGYVEVEVECYRRATVELRVWEDPADDEPVYCGHARLPVAISDQLKAFDAGKRHHFARGLEFELVWRAYRYRSKAKAALRP